jgi:hypothetical protein
VGRISSDKFWQSDEESLPRRRKYLNRREKFRFCGVGMRVRAALWTPCNNGDAICTMGQQISP